MWNCGGTTFNSLRTTGVPCALISESCLMFFLEATYRKQLDKSDQLKNVMSVYWQDITQRGEQKSYRKLKHMVRIHRERKRLDKNKDAWSKDKAAVSAPANDGAPANTDHAAGDRSPSNGPKQGDCRQWLTQGKCSRGEGCPWGKSHIQAKAGTRGKGQRGNSPGRQGKGTGNERGRSPDKKGGKRR